MKDKRKFERSPIELAASYGTADDPGILNEMTIQNISEGGFAFVCDKSVQPGQELELKIDQEADKAITLKVQVVWIKECSDQSRLAGVQILEEETSANYEDFIHFFKTIS